MLEEYLKFGKNIAFSIVPMIVGGVVGSELTDLLTDSKQIISIGSLVGEFAFAFGTFLPLHARDNLNLYREENSDKFKWREFTKDAAKIILTFGVADVFYLGLRPATNYLFLDLEYSISAASFYSYLISYPAHHLVKIPVAKYLGVIRERNVTTPGTKKSE